MVDLNKIRAGQEALVEKVSPEKIKESALSTLHECYDTVRGSGSVMTELGKVKDAYISLPADVVGNALKASAQLLTVQPIKATCTVAKGLKDTCVNMAKIAVSPVPTAIAAAQQSLAKVKDVGVAVGKAPLKMVQTAQNGCHKFLDLFGSSASSAPSNTNAAPPEQAQAA